MGFGKINIRFYPSLWKWEIGFTYFTNQSQYCISLEIIPYGVKLRRFTLFTFSDCLWRLWQIWTLFPLLLGVLCSIGEPTLTSVPFFLSFLMALSLPLSFSLSLSFSWISSKDEVSRCFFLSFGIFLMVYICIFLSLSFIWSGHVTLQFSSTGFPLSSCRIKCRTSYS